MENVTPTKVGDHCPAGTDYADTPARCATPAGQGGEKTTSHNLSLGRVKGQLNLFPL